MQSLSLALRALPPDLDHDGPEPSFLIGLSDHDLIRAVAVAIERPKADRFSSFLLHAPLELLARASLLPMVAPRNRSAARLRIARIAACYAGGEELNVPARKIASLAAAWSMLTTALREQDPDTADAAISYLSASLSIGELCTGLIDRIAPCLGAAAHAPLLLAAQVDAQARFDRLPFLLRPATRLLAAPGAQRLSWIDEQGEKSGPLDLWAALAEPPRIKLDTDSIAPTMVSVEAKGMAARLLTRATGAPVDDIARTLMRIAAASMVQDSAQHVPYGWTHCMTLPQGLLALRRYSADPARLARIAATYVLGFRATLGSVHLDREGPSSRRSDMRSLANYAATHQDAHLSKYIVTCIAARAADPLADTLFEAAANRLVAYWKGLSGDTC